MTRMVTNSIGPAHISYLSYKHLKGKSVTGMGWGKLTNNTFPRILRVANMKILRNSECVKRVKKVSHEELLVDKNLLCCAATPFVLMMNVSMVCFVILIEFSF
jgi:hypothetical protein